MSQEYFKDDHFFFVQENQHSLLSPKNGIFDHSSNMNNDILVDRNLKVYWGDGGIDHLLECLNSKEFS
jgi:hypothetical protein